MAENTSQPRTPPAGRLILASASAQRLALLRQIGLNPDVQPVDIDEAPHAGESAQALVQRLAQGKARACRDLPGNSDAVVLGADTLVVLDNRVLGKPADRDEALGMLRALSGREHAVFSGVYVHCGDYGGVCVVRSRVRLMVLDETQRVRYWNTGEPLGKAGAYAIQGLAGQFVESLTGSYSNVVGLPLHESAQLLSRAGVPVLAMATDGAEGGATQVATEWANAMTTQEATAMQGDHE